MAKDRYKYFRIEARELVEGLTQAAIRLEGEPACSGNVEQVLRLAHTLKGAAGVVGLEDIRNCAHGIEDALQSFRDKSSSVPRRAIDDVLSLVDIIGRELAALDPGSQPAPSVSQPDPEAVAADEQDAHAPETFRVELPDMNAVARGLTEMGVQFERLAGLSASLLRIRSALAQVSSTGRTHEIVHRAVEELAAVERQLTTGLERSHKELSCVSKVATRMRLLPLGSLAIVLERAGRDAARRADKQVTFEMIGGHQRVDAHVLAPLREVLLHLVRNAVDHGIETPSERVAANKEVRGRVELVIERRGRCVAVLCRDDGRGIDVEAVRRAAVKKGIVSQNQADALELDRALALIFHPGLTTATQVTDLSGRGTGLDIVRDVADKLKGHASVRSVPGQGTTIEIVIPISLSSVTVLSVEVGELVVAIPLAAICQVRRISRDDGARTADGHSILFEDQVIPLVSLARLIGEKSAASDRAAVIVRSGNVVAALSVSRVHGSEDVVVQPTPALAGHLPAVMGASLDAEGNPKLILEPSELVLAARTGEIETAEAGAHAQPRILVIDDSLTTRMVQQAVLEAAGYEVDLAESGEQALAMAHDRRYGLFLCDVEMPGMDGFEFVRRTRSDPELGSIPAFLVTTRGSPDDRRRGMEAGAYAHIIKSEFDENQLIRLIRGVMGS